MKIFLPIILLFSLVAPAKAQMNCGTLAEYYLEYAKPTGDRTKNFQSSGYFIGFVSGFRVGDDWRYFNVPNGVNDGQLSHVVGKWLRANPEKWHLGMNLCVYDALYATWPKK